MKSETARLILGVLKKYNFVTTEPIMRKIEVGQDVDTICIIVNTETSPPVCIGIITKEKGSEWLKIRCFDGNLWLQTLCKMSREIENYTVSLFTDLCAKKIIYNNGYGCDGLGNCEYTK